MILSYMIARVATTLAALNPSLNPREAAQCKANLCTPDHHAKIVSNYIGLWFGNLDFLNQTISPALLFQADRFPASANCDSGVGSNPLPINSSAAFGEFVSNSCVGYSKYGFKVDFWFGHENNVVIRWSLDAVIGQNFTRFPT
jgi:hypothetical protein